MFNGISTIVGYLIPKPYLYKKSSGIIYPNALVDCDKRVYIFLNSISPKVIIIVRLEIVVAYNATTLS